MDNTQIVNTIININHWLVLKFIYLGTILLFVIFAIIVIRQIYLMTKTLNGTIDLPLKGLGYLYLGLIIFIFFLALIVL